MSKNISKDTIVRTVVLMVALINQALVMSGKDVLPWTDTAVGEAVSYGLTVAASALAWWKNNSFTQEATQADEYMKELKTEGE